MHSSIHPTHGTIGELIQSQPKDLIKHSRLVSHKASDLALAAGCASDEQDRIRMGSLLHDIGKQFIPLAVLEKKDQLSRKEFRQIQEHPWIGYSYLTHFVSDSIVLNTVLYHHERWNGTGYPFGLEGEQIPLGARICALADVWDALISNRCYRSAWSTSRAVDLIWAGAGSLFDPQLAYQFLSMIVEHYSHDALEERQETPALPNAGRDAPALEHFPLDELHGEPPAS